MRLQVVKLLSALLVRNSPAIAKEIVMLDMFNTLIVSVVNALVSLKVMQNGAAVRPHADKTTDDRPLFITAGHRIPGFE